MIITKFYNTSIKPHKQCILLKFILTKVNKDVDKSHQKSKRFIENNHL
jgi:hypothetical protein